MPSLQSPLEQVGTKPILCCCGYSGSGKTTLLVYLFKKWVQQGYQIGFLKHTHHSIGQITTSSDNNEQNHHDTANARQAGAKASFIFNEVESCFHSKATSLAALKDLPTQVDFWILEGLKDSSYPKIVFVHPERGVPDFLSWQQTKIAGNILVYVTASQEQADAINDEISQKIESGSALLKDEIAHTVPLAFCRDNLERLIEEIFRRFQDYLTNQNTLNFAVLSGGASKRMGQDKALLDYGHGPQAKYLMERLQVLFPQAKIYFSGSPKPQLSEDFTNFIEDRYLGMGPLGALLSLFDYNQHSAWCVVPCDLVHWHDSLIMDLVQSRNSLKAGNCFQHEEGQSEPLFAIYEPSAREHLLNLLPYKKYSLQPFTLSEHFCRKFIAVEMRDFFSNCNTPAEREKFLQQRH